MKYLSILLFFVLAATAAIAQSSDEKTIRDLMQQQASDWNTGNLQAFMQGYLKSDSIMFIGHNGITYGWDSTLAHYQQAYPNKAAMGTLRFELKELKQLSPDYFFVVGKFILDREQDSQSGHFDVLFKKVNGRWFIISDHTS